jgi:hypothetical protein
MTSCSQKCPSRAPAFIEDEVPVLSHAQRNGDVAARTIAGDAVPDAITDDEPTVPINFRRAGLRIADPRPAR